MKEELIAIIRDAGRIMLEAHDIDASVLAKEGEANFVTAYDSAVQKFLFTELAKLYPDAVFVGEEDAADRVEELCRGQAFVIDPIDGTQNFIRRMGHSAISVALCEEGQVVLGCVLNPYADELYYAERGKGATLTQGGKTVPLHVSQNGLENSIVLFGAAPYYAELRDRTYNALRTLAERALDIRRCGSAALDLCRIADGRADVFFEMRLSPWDYAAGSLLVKEAGGVISRIDGDAISLTEKCSILCGNPRAYAEARELEL